jgi:urease accessory protein
LTLRFDGGRMRVARQDPPWKIVRAFGPLVHLHNVSGGVLAGDHLALHVEIGNGERAQITTTGATRLYRHRPGSKASEQSVSIRVEKDALLEYLPDPLIPFAHARHTQRTSIELGPGATMFWWETLAPGRQAMGELFAYDRLAIHSRVDICGRGALREDFVLEPGLRPLKVIARLGKYTHMASFYACQEGRIDWTSVESRLEAVGREQTSSVWGVSTLAHGGVVVRGLSESGRGLALSLVQFWTAAKQILMSEAAIPPRKVY